MFNPIIQLKLLRYIAGFMNAGKYTPYELIEIAIINKRISVPNYADYLEDAKQIYIESHYGYDLLTIKPACEALYTSMRYKPIKGGVENLIVEIITTYDMQLLPWDREKLKPDQIKETLKI